MTKTKKEAETLTVKNVAEMLEDGSRRWGTGRDRDTNLLSEGYNLADIQAARQEVRRKRLGSD